MANKLRDSLKKAGKTAIDKSYDLPVRTKPFTGYEVLEVIPPPEGAPVLTAREQRRKTTEFVELTLTGSKGTKYRVSVPKSYTTLIPKIWEWNEERFEGAELLAEGLGISAAAEVMGVNRMVLYGWLEHPEFREHVDALIMESGFANRRERISRISALTNRLVKKINNELDGVKLTDKSIGAVLSAIGQYSKHIAQEKEEFVESSKVDQTTTLNGSVGVGHVNVTTLLDSKSGEEREKLQEEFNKMGDAIIRALTTGE